MKGIHCALQGRLGQDVELRRSESGKDWCRLSVGVEGDEVTWVSVAVFEEKARALAGLAVEVYVEGRVSLNAWTGRDGVERSGLAVTAWRIEVLGQIGRRLHARSTTRSRSGYHPDHGGERQAAWSLSSNYSRTFAGSTKGRS